MGQGKGGKDFAALSKLSSEHLKSGMTAEYIRDLQEMAEILEREGRHLDELKVLILAFYIALNCDETIPAIDRGLVDLICKAATKTGASKYDVGELLLATVHSDTAPKKIFTPRDSLYVLELCMNEEWHEADAIVERLRCAAPVL